MQASTENAERVYQALCEFGAPKEQFSIADFSSEGVVYQIGVVPQRIDILTQISGIDFEAAWAGRDEIEVEGLRIPVLGIQELIENKESVGREKDLLDVKLLKKHKTS